MILRPTLAASCLALAACAPPASPTATATATATATPNATPTTTLTAPSPEAAPLVLGETLRVDSKILGERRVVNVYLPPGYAESRERYPVLYMPDGGLKEDFPHVMGLVDVSIKNETMRPFLVVGIENTERRRDLVGPTTLEAEKTIAPHAGGADKFRAFLRDELKPLVASRYRVTAESAIVGESFAGLFVIETLLVAPDLFDGYVAVDPSLWWNHGALVDGAAARLATWPGKPKALFLATADSKESQQAGERLAAIFRDKKPGGLDWHLAPMPEENHGTIFHPAAIKAFRTIFAPAKKPGGG
jgi:uncharacterized protein